MSGTVATLTRYVDRYSERRVRLGGSAGIPPTVSGSSWSPSPSPSGQRPDQQLGRSHVEAWMETITPLAPATRRSKLSVVKLFCRWLVLEGYIKRDPTIGIRSPRQPKAAPRVLDQPAVVKPLHSVPDARARLIIILMAQLGLRCVEVSRLELGDISDTQVRVRGKLGNERVLPLVPEVRTALATYLAERGNRSGGLPVVIQVTSKSIGEGGDGSWRRSDGFLGDGSGSRDGGSSSAS